MIFIEKKTFQTVFWLDLPQKKDYKLTFSFLSPIYFYGETNIFRKHNFACKNIFILLHL